MASSTQPDWAAIRAQFRIADPDLIYLDGNSLGRLPEATAARLHAVVADEWGDWLIRSWNEGWFEAPNRIGDKIGRLLGARPGEVIMADSTSVNLFKLSLAALRAQPDRRVIVTDDLNFPSDLYVLNGVAQLAGGEVRVIPSGDGIHGPVEALADAIDDNTALVSLSLTTFRSGYTYDMDILTELAHLSGALMLWDLSHAAGAIEVDLTGSGADLAVGCTYKYLNGGPGAPAFLYVRAPLQERLSNPISGWIGRENQFDFGLDYRPAPGIQRFLTGTPPILSLSAIEPGIDLLLDIGMSAIRARSLALSEHLIGLWDRELRPNGYRLNSPLDPAWRGSHVSLGHAEAGRITRALIEEMHVLPDFRQPDNIRLGLSPLYNTIEEIETAVHRLRGVVVDRLYERYETGDRVVT